MCDQKTWELIKAEYIAGGTSYGALAKKYGVSKASIGRRAASQGWPNLVRRIRDETETKVVEHVSDAQADKFCMMYGLCDTFQQRVSELMQMPLKNGREAHDVIDALNGAMQLIRDLYGLPGEQQQQGRQKLQVMRKELELKQKQQAQAAGEDAPVEKWVIEMEDKDTSVE